MNVFFKKTGKYEFRKRLSSSGNLWQKKGGRAVGIITQQLYNMGTSRKYAPSPHHPHPNHSTDKEYTTDTTSSETNHDPILFLYFKDTNTVFYENYGKRI